MPVGQTSLTNDFYYPSLYRDDAELESQGYEWATFNADRMHPSIESSVDTDSNMNLVERKQHRSHNTHRVAASKIPIPRIAQAYNRGKSRCRVSQACQACKERKAKCSGEQTGCQQCRHAGVHCVYGDRKRERTAKQLADLTARVQAYETLLQSHLEFGPAQHADKAPIKAQEVQSSDLGTSSAAASLGVEDHVNEDLYRDDFSQSIGYIGALSEVAWLYQLRHKLSYCDLQPDDEVSNRPSVSSVGYFLDDAKFSVLQDVDALWSPPELTADKLISCYFRAVHPTFPIVRKVFFWSQYKAYYSDPKARPGKRWLAVLNLVFAIAARHLQLMGDEVFGQRDEHLTYFTRAWELSSGTFALSQPSNLQQIQIEGLQAFYLVQCGYLSRSWRVIGIAMRSAMTMGLHLRNETEGIDELSKEARYRLWWGLLSLETTLCAMTGRPLSPVETLCTVPLPKQTPEDEFGQEASLENVEYSSAHDSTGTALFEHSNHARRDMAKPMLTTVSEPSTQTPKKRKDSVKNPIWHNGMFAFRYSVDLTLLMREVIVTLYSPAVTQRSWKDTLCKLSALDTRADDWLSRLPSEIRFTNERRYGDLNSPGLFLALQYCSTKLIISHPCLHLVAYSPASEESLDPFCITMANKCVNMAGTVLDILPEAPNDLMDSAPWWIVLHQLVQSTAVILAQFLTQRSRDSMEAGDHVEHLKKALRWLSQMSSSDLCAKRAWNVCMDLLQHGETLGLNTHGLGA